MKIYILINLFVYIKHTKLLYNYIIAKLVDYSTVQTVCHCVRIIRNDVALNCIDVGVCAIAIPYKIWIVYEWQATEIEHAWSYISVISNT